jgi:hypothetical protein
MGADFCPTCGEPQLGVHYHEAKAAPTRREKNVRATRSTADEPISQLKSFATSGSFSGQRISPSAGTDLSFGRLYSGAALQTIKSLPDINYVVKSYGTPIGVHSESQGWVIPKDKHSMTTSIHQGTLRRGAAASGRPVQEV